MTAPVVSPWATLLTPAAETFDEVLAVVERAGATLSGFSSVVTLSRIEPGRWCPREILPVLAREIRELRMWSPLRVYRSTAGAEDVRARAMIFLLWRAYRAAMRTRDQRPPRYPACPLCGRPLYPCIAHGPAGTLFLGCIQCGELVHASEKACARAHQAAQAEGLSFLPATFKEPKTWLFVADLDDGGEELERARRSQVAAKEILWARKLEAEGR